MSTTKSLTVAGAKRTKKYQACIAVGLDETEALKYAGYVAQTPVDETEANIALLVQAGFTREMAIEALSDKPVAADATGAPVRIEPKQSPKDVADQLVKEQGYKFGTGRVYGPKDGSLLAAGARVLKTGVPEIVKSSGVGRTAAVQVVRQDNGDVYFQNLMVLPQQG